VEKSVFSDLKAFETILEKIPPGTSLHLSNSTPVRYSQLFSTRPDILYSGNRGTSGIDGCISTAAGMAYAGEAPVTVIAGDLAFIYDSNALWNRYLGKDFRIIVINNGGGNIFRLMETSPEINSVRDFFETPHRVNLKMLAEAFGIVHYFCNDLQTLKEKIGDFYAADGPAILEIGTDADADAKVFRDYFNHLKKGI